MRSSTINDTYIAVNHRTIEDAVSNLPRTLQENHLRMLSKMDLRVQMDAKSAQLKNKINSKRFSSLADA